MGIDHGYLFQESDRQRRRTDQADYECYDDKDDPDLVLMEKCFARPLRSVAERLDLMGYSVDRARQSYQQIRTDEVDLRKEMAGGDEGQLIDPIDFEQFLEFIKSKKIENLSDEYDSKNGFDSEAARREFGGTFNLNRIPGYDEAEWNAYSARSYFGGLIGILHPYLVLRLLAENPDNLESLVIWQYGPLVSSGWEKEEIFQAGAKRTDKFLIVTEGTSDVRILQHAFGLLRPGVADFFYYIDLSHSHPFQGAGNLAKFAEGLAKIDIQNQTLFVLDNDAEGIDALRRIGDLNLPPNMGAMALPNLNELSAMITLGPEGIGEADINGRAAAIECYLDLKSGGVPPPQIIWKNFKEKIAVYHGALRQKEAYTKYFLKQTKSDLDRASYDLSKLEKVLDKVLAEAVVISMARHSASMSD